MCKVVTDDLIGTPFAWGARGPHAYDCYGLVMEVARRHGQVLPEFAQTVDWAGLGENQQGHTAAMMAGVMSQWQETGCNAGAVVLFRMGRLVSHVGYMLNEHTMIHALEQTGGVTVQRIDHWQQRIMGFYRYVGSSK